MAKNRLSKATYVEHGYGQVEPNHLSAQRTAQIYAQLPSEAALENGEFVKYDYANGAVNKEGAGEWMLVFNEVKVYDAREQDDDFVLEAKGTPRVFKTNVGDIFTTNMVMASEAIKEGAKLAPNAEGILAITEDTDGMVWEIAKVYTLADGQAAVKVMRIN